MARALIGDPRAVLADEPTGSVDSATGGTIVATLLDWAQRRGGTLVMVTHDETLAASLDRVMTMADGRLATTGATLPAHSVDHLAPPPAGGADGGPHAAGSS